MDASGRAMVEAIHASPTQAVLHLSGGASQALGWLMSVPGASNTVLEAVVPYSRMSMIQLLGKVPSQFACRQTAEDMALMAYNRALRLSTPGFPALGVGFSGSLASTRPKLGDHRFHVSTRTSDKLWASTVTLSKGLRTREEEDTVSSQFLLKAIAYASKVPTTFISGLADSEIPNEFEVQFDEDQELEQLISGQICFKVYPFSSAMSKAERKIILSGSFNPLHDGHLKLLEVASR
ncbi:nucleotidylyl transferase superfamily protein [Striga asiatica]|uniref:Nucleotidylyl transferase superfamily protein n=1 Tax=Striga asiatica TaxID=4170 RepID=A0A5A7PBN5_STRAF|nr:nucleotidylyl transferase superfamily protein [Striga asiatica]